MKWLKFFLVIVCMPLWVPLAMLATTYLAVVDSTLVRRNNHA